MALDLLIKGFILTFLRDLNSLFIFHGPPSPLPPLITPSPLPSHHWTIIAMIVCTNEL